MTRLYKKSRLKNILEKTSPAQSLSSINFKSLPFEEKLQVIFKRPTLKHIYKEFFYPNWPLLPERLDKLVASHLEDLPDEERDNFIDFIQILSNNHLELITAVKNNPINNSQRGFININSIFSYLILQYLADDSKLLNQIYSEEELLDIADTEEIDTFSSLSSRIDGSVLDELFERIRTEELNISEILRWQGKPRYINHLGFVKRFHQSDELQDRS